MPARNDIQQQIMKRKAAGQDEVRRSFMKNLAGLTKRDTVLYASAFTSPPPHIPALALSVSLDDVQGFMAALHGLKGDELDLILHSPGGSMEAAEQIVQYLRSKYRHIRAIVPQNAMSAATMIACACDAIVMGKHSAIGPIDPQVTFPTPSGQFTVPAQAILDEFERAKKEIASDQSTIPLWATKIQAYPHGLLTHCQTTLDLAREKVAAWLSNYMFKDDGDRAEKGRRIADWLGNAREHKTHARPISADEAEAHGLKVERLEADQTFQEAVLSVFHATMVTFQVTQCVRLVENHEGNGLYTMIQVAAVPVAAPAGAG
jgi:hypothetical protein